MQDLTSSSSHPPFQPFHNPAHCPCFHQSQALTGNIPHSHSLVQTRRHNQVFRWVELGAHHIVIMTSQNTGCQREKKWLRNVRKYTFFLNCNASFNNYTFLFTLVRCIASKKKNKNKTKNLRYLNLTVVSYFEFHYNIPDTGPGLPVPNSDCLVIWGAQNPWILLQTGKWIQLQRL